MKIFKIIKKIVIFQVFKLNVLTEHNKESLFNHKLKMIHNKIKLILDNLTSFFYLLNCYDLAIICSTDCNEN